MPGFSICRIILDIWQSFEYARDIKYAKVLNMLQYSSDSNIVLANVVILKFLSVQFLHPGSLQLIILSFFNLS